ncbi:MAG: methyltransferase domain-containing protein [Leptolyngbyaceae cyanobacterium bins.349]|nr:methyltransferase domain-containing protein [Leptolyngbyaceae cyanobacterium bins.349]
MSFTHSPESYNTKSAKEVVPVIVDLLNPKSVVDVGCGIGTWLSIFKENGINDVLGIDGEYVDRNLLYQHIDAKDFIAYDLTKEITLNRKFDLVISLEVAEHIPEECADKFINTLVSLGDFILFSAAIPGQGGENHINEQWPTYWQEKFNDLGFEVYDFLRLSLWSNENIEWWYKQNIFLAVRGDIDFNLPKSTILPKLVHPENYELKVEENEKLKKELKNITSGRISLIFSLKILVKSLRNLFLGH